MFERIHTENVFEGTFKKLSTTGVHHILRKSYFRSNYPLSKRIGYLHICSCPDVQLSNLTVINQLGTEEKWIITQKAKKINVRANNQS